MLRSIYRRALPKALRDRLWDLRHRGALLYAGVFGPLGGPAVRRRLRRPGGLQSVALPGYRSEVLVRPASEDVVAFEKIFLMEEYEPPPGLEPELIIDGGANVGYSALYFAHHFPRATVLAVEPAPSNLELLRRNVESYPRVRVVPAALWGEPGRLRIEDPEADSLRFRVEPAPPGEPGEVEATTVEALLAAAGGARIGLLKLDVEGAEREIFAGGPAWLERVDCLMVELHERYLAGCERAFEEAVGSYPFERYRQGENVVLVRR